MPLGYPHLSPCLIPPFWREMMIHHLQTSQQDRSNRETPRRFTADPGSAEDGGKMLQNIEKKKSGLAVYHGLPMVLPCFSCILSSKDDTWWHSGVLPWCLWFLGSWWCGAIVGNQTQQPNIGQMRWEETVAEFSWVMHVIKPWVCLLTSKKLLRTR